MNSLKAFNFLPGSWKIARTINNNSNMQGMAEFTPINQDELFYRENGILILPNGHKVLNVYREYVYCYKEGTIFISTKADDNPSAYLFRLKFVITNSELPSPILAEASHICRADRYDASYEFFEDKVNVVTRVNGPAKDYIITTLFERYV